MFKSMIFLLGRLPCDHKDKKAFCMSINNDTKSENMIKM